MFLNDKTIFITGGTGSFGSKFIDMTCREFKPRKVIVFSRDELKQYEMMQWVKETGFPVQFVMGDIRDRDRVRRAMTGAEVVIHAAALKHVPAAEANPFEFVRTNIVGSHNIIESALDCKVQRVVALSTDKACNPVNLYGATKLAADKLFVAAGAKAADHGTTFSVVRYGNVIGSRGSVIPFFMHQAHKKMIPITDPGMTRFLITLNDGVNLVWRALEMQKGGEIFVPKIPSMGIMDLAEVVAPDVPKHVVGIRPGEKLHEVMISEDDARCTVDAGSYYAILPTEAHAEKMSKAAGIARVPENFRYSSDNNKEWMTRAQLKSILDKFELRGHELVNRQPQT
jgi:UDP-N-acetylglucosamine 4,6-dehydratase (inverting)